jgi:Fe-S cluster assembly ATPase SufC
MSADEQKDGTGGISEARSCLAAIEIGEWPGLGGNVTLSVSERVTVLVGQNGAGKSLIVEAIHGATRAAVLNTQGSFAAAPRFFRCEITHSGVQRYFYQYQFDMAPPGDDEDRGRAQAWIESCRRPGADADVWKIENASLTLGRELTIPFAHGEGLVSVALLAERGGFVMPKEAIELKELFRGTHLVQAGVPRTNETQSWIGPYRREVLMSSESLPGYRRVWGPASGQFNRVTRLARDILRMYETSPDDYQQFHEHLRRLGLVDDIEIAFSEEPRPTRARTTQSRTYASVLFDGINIGLCSDGTQRVGEILLHLLQHDTTCLLIEEPEIAVHPSLLAKLLAIIESYSSDRQIIISTHSPQIVDWCKPKDLRLVERHEGRTSVSVLGDDDLARVHRYLSYDGTFSEYIYHRSEA